MNCAVLLRLGNESVDFKPFKSIKAVCWVTIKDSLGLRGLPFVWRFIYDSSMVRSGRRRCSIDGPIGKPFFAAVSRQWPLASLWMWLRLRLFVPSIIAPNLLHPELSLKIEPNLVCKVPTHQTPLKRLNWLINAECETRNEYLWSAKCVCVEL